MKLWCDLETYCEVPLSHGVHAYAEKAEVLLWAWAMEDDPVEVWDLTETREMPSGLHVAIHTATGYWWHGGGMFDRIVLKHAMPTVFHSMPMALWGDTMIQAYAHGLPGSLDTLCQLFGIPEDLAKQKDGKALIQLFCKPRPKTSKLHRATRETHSEEWERFKDYAKADITAMRALHHKMPKWNYPVNPKELALWQLNMRVNMRGMQMDVELAKAAVAAVEKEKSQLAIRTTEMTDGDVQSSTQRNAMLAHILSDYGVALPDLTASTVERRLTDPDLPDGLKELLANRLQASKTSASKYQSLLRGVSSDGRLRGTQQFCGAARTGRVAHRLFQPGNMPRPDTGLMARELGVARLGKGDAQRYLDTGVDAVKAGCADMVFSDVMGLSANLVRGAIIAPPGKKLVISDLSNIEGRITAWVAGEDWKIKAFREYDVGTGPDLYKLGYSRSFGVPVEEVTDDQRQLGKVMDLMFGYEGGVGACLTFSTAYGVDLSVIRIAVSNVINALDPLIYEEAKKAWHWAREVTRTYGLDEDTYVACDILKRVWRRAHPRIALFWGRLKDGVTDAIRCPGATFHAGLLKIRRDGQWLRISLPSGRYLSYPQPQLEDRSISYAGLNQYTRKWGRINTYGGKLLENIAQAIARDVLFHNALLAEEAGYAEVLSLHDELVTEAGDTGEYDDSRLSSIIATVQPWAEGLPLAAKGFTTYRYRKD